MRCALLLEKNGRFVGFNQEAEERPEAVVLHASRRIPRGAKMSLSWPRRFAPSRRRERMWVMGAFATMERARRPLRGPISSSREERLGLAGTATRHRESSEVWFSQHEQPAATARRKIPSFRSPKDGPWTFAADGLAAAIAAKRGPAGARTGHRP